MSPLRKFGPSEKPLFAGRATRRPWSWAVLLRPWWWPLRDRLFSPRQWALPLATVIAAALMVGAITGSVLMLISHETYRRDASTDKAVLSYVRSFMAEFTSLDPFHANDYVDHVLAQATGEFAKKYQDDQNQILLQIAKAEPTTGTVLDAGLERWNDDGSATVLVATEVTSKSPDGKQVFENATRWVATAEREGGEWKISNLLRVM